MAVDLATVDHGRVMVVRAGTDPDLVTATADLAVVTAGTADLVPVQVINRVVPQVVAVVAVDLVPAGTAIPVAVAGDISQAQAQAARAAATCARTVISVTAAMVARAAVIADSRTQKRRSQERRFCFIRLIVMPGHILWEGACSR